jgi:hypothetical protein
MVYFFRAVEIIVKMTGAAKKKGNHDCDGICDLNYQNISSTF